MRIVICAAVLHTISSILAGEPETAAKGDAGKSTPWNGKAHEIPGTIED